MKLLTEIIALCDYASVSKEGKLSINGIFDELRVQNLPNGIARAFLVTTIKGKPSTSYRLALKVENYKNETLKINPLNIDIQTSANGKNNLLIELVNFGPFEKEGEYRFVIYNGDEEVGSTILKIIHVKPNQKIEYKLPN